MNIHISGGFKPTVSAKETVMFKDVTTFHTQMVLTEKNIRNWMKGNDSYLQYLDKTLRCNLPEVYVVDAKGSVAPVNGWNDKRIIGDQFEKGELTKCGQDMVSSVEKEVLTPINQVRGILCSRTSTLYFIIY